MTDPTTDAAREDEIAAQSGVTLNAKLSDRASGLQVAPIALTIGFPDSGDPAARFREWYNPAHWFWWGRGLGVFIGILVREREAAVSRARDEAWRAAVEAVRVGSRPAFAVTGEGFEAYPACESCGNDITDCLCGVKMSAHNAALDTLLARMDGAK